MEAKEEELEDWKQSKWKGERKTSLPPPDSMNEWIDYRERRDTR